MFLEILLPVLGTLCCYLIFHAIQFIYHDITSPLRDIVGPKSRNILLGHFGEMADYTYLTDKWQQQYGPNFQLQGLFNVLVISHSLRYLLMMDHSRSEPVLANTVCLVGKVVLVVERDDHKRQASNIHIPFAQLQQQPIIATNFGEKSLELRDIWARQVSAGGSSAQIEMLSWLRRMTLDVIGQAGFNYQFNAGEPDELNDAFTQPFHSPSAQRNAGLRLAQTSVPILLLVVRSIGASSQATIPLTPNFQPLPSVRALNYARAKMMAIGQQLVEKSKAAIKASQDDKLLSSGRRDCSLCF
ncbi:hypothetical protein C8J57DRAFT_1468497 [Mycena rebaudengoi]|nr:hypothetical protein C8J57DRAFT_1468497 [Mycena rebaudengoi]